MANINETIKYKIWKENRITIKNKDVLMTFLFVLLAEISKRLNLQLLLGVSCAFLILYILGFVLILIFSMFGQLSKLEIELFKTDWKAYKEVK